MPCEVLLNIGLMWCSAYLTPYYLDCFISIALHLQIVLKIVLENILLIAYYVINAINNSYWRYL